jgi:hypothetical protein
MSRSRTLTIWLALISAAAISAAATSTATAADCNRTIFDGGGYIYDFEAASINPGAMPPTLVDLYGSPATGGANGPTDTPPGPAKTVAGAWAGWGNAFVTPPDVTVTASYLYDGPADACGFDQDSQEIAFPLIPMQGLEVQRRWYVDPGPLHGARVLTVLRNPSGSPISVGVIQGDPTGTKLIGGVSTETRASSDGGGSFSPASYWGVTATSEATSARPALAHVWDGVGGATRVRQVRPSNGSATTLFWEWQVTIPAGATAALISYEVQSVVPGRETAAEVAAAVAQAEAREHQSPASLYAGMSAAEIAGTMNWPHPPANATIAPVTNANAATRVRLDGSGSRSVPGLPQCANSYAWRTDDRATGSGPVFDHVFAAGTHKATLTVSNGCGGSQSSTASVKVAPALRLGKLKLNRRAGTAALRVTTLGPGKLTLGGKGVRSQAKRVTKASTVSVTVKPAGKALKALVRTGRAKLKVAVSLRPNGGRATRLSKTIVLKRAG